MTTPCLAELITVVMGNIWEPWIELWRASTTGWMYPQFLARTAARQSQHSKPRATYPRLDLERVDNLAHGDDLVMLRGDDRACQRHSRSELAALNLLLGHGDRPVVMLDHLGEKQL